MWLWNPPSPHVLTLTLIFSGTSVAEFRSALDFAGLHPFLS